MNVEGPAQNEAAAKQDHAPPPEKGDNEAKKTGPEVTKKGPKGQGNKSDDLNLFTDPSNMDYTEGPAEDPLNSKKRKGTDNSTESEDEEPLAKEDPTLVANLIAETREAHARAAEMTKMARVQCAGI